MINYDKLISYDKYIQAKPFPHAIIDGLFDDNYLEEILKEFKSISGWRRKSATSKKITNPNIKSMSNSTQELFKELESKKFLKALTKMTGIKDLIADASYFGGGLHCNNPGSILHIHTDFNYYGNKYRRINILIYLNHEWKEEWNGYLELWNSDVSERVQYIKPIFNRTVIFNTTDTSFHGHPLTLECPKGVSRKSVALYYYTQKNPGFKVSRRTNYKKPNKGVI